jgi:hypothetical protein
LANIRIKIEMRSNKYIRIKSYSMPNPALNQAPIPVPKHPINRLELISRNRILLKIYFMNLDQLKTLFIRHSSQRNHNLQMPSYRLYSLTQPYPFDYFTLFFTPNLFRTITTNINRYINILLVYGHVVVLDYIRTSVTLRSLKLLDLALLPFLDIIIRTQKYHLCSVSHRNL